MLINSVILVLQETLEAALLISVLLSICYQRRLRVNWLPFGLIGGVVFSIVYATNMETVSAWFDYMGQEIINALLQTCIAVLILVYAWVVFTIREPDIRALHDPKQKPTNAPLIAALSAAIMVVMAITREGAEVYLYISGFFLGGTHLPSVLAGSALGFGIGLSIGTLLFFVLSSDHSRWRRRITLLLLALFAGNMLSQSVLQLTQADWITASAPCWDSSAWLSEQSITGKLMYASLGYEATPSAQQIAAHISGTLLVLGLIALRLSSVQRKARLEIPKDGQPAENTGTAK